MGRCYWSALQGSLKFHPRTTKEAEVFVFAVGIITDPFIHELTPSRWHLNSRHSSRRWLCSFFWSLWVLVYHFLGRCFQLKRSTYFFEKSGLFSLFLCSLVCKIWVNESVGFVKVFGLRAQRVKTWIEELTWLTWVLSLVYPRCCMKVFTQAFIFIWWISSTKITSCFFCFLITNDHIPKQNWKSVAWFPIFQAAVGLY